MKEHYVALILVIALISQVRYTEQVNVVYNWDITTYENGTVIVKDLDESFSDSEESLAEFKENVCFYLYNQNNTNGSQIYLGDDDSFLTSGFDVSLPTRIVIHGWESSVTAKMCSSIKDAYLNLGDFNIILVYWDTWSSQNYVAARMKIAGIGQYIAIFFEYLVALGMILKDLLVIGHSLGAHIAGVACRNATITCPILIGLDPAGPLFYGTTMNARMTKTDATCTEVIHTCAGKLGYNGNLGDIDHWPNGGSKQTDCGLDLVWTCAHSRSYYYYAESISNNSSFIARKCDNYTSYESGDCVDNASTHMGRGCELGAASGDYYLDTNGESPYSES